MSLFAYVTPTFMSIVIQRDSSLCFLFLKIKVDEVQKTQLLEYRGGLKISEIF